MGPRGRGAERVLMSQLLVLISHLLCLQSYLSGAAISWNKQQNYFCLVLVLFNTGTGKYVHFSSNQKIVLRQVPQNNNNNNYWDFPGGAVVKNPPTGLPWWRSG